MRHAHGRGQACLQTVLVKYGSVPVGILVEHHIAFTTAMRSAGGGTALTTQHSHYLHVTKEAGKVRLLAPCGVSHCDSPDPCRNTVTVRQIQGEKGGSSEACRCWACGPSSLGRCCNSRRSYSSNRGLQSQLGKGGPRQLQSGVDVAAEKFS